MKMSKAEIYRVLYQMNTGFMVVVESCQKLYQTGLFQAGAVKLFPAFVQELQAEINRELLNTLETIEERDWVRYGQAMKKWERYLKGTVKNKRRKK